MLLVATDPRLAEHDPGRGHPERPVRLQAVLAGLAAVGLDEAVQELPARRATRAELERVHTAKYLDQLEAFCARGGGSLDADTAASAGSWDAALLAAGSGLAAVEALEAGTGTAAFCAVRPPGHHAEPTHAMGFCLINNVAVTAAALRARGDRVLVVDWDAHHGNGTQDMFWTDPDVMYVSMHEWPLYPGTGRLDDVGRRARDRSHRQLPVSRGHDGRRLSRRARHGGRAARRAVRARLGAGLGRLRRAPSRPAHGPWAPVGRFRRSGRAGAGIGARGPDGGLPRRRLRPRGAPRFGRGDGVDPGRRVATAGAGDRGRPRRRWSCGPSTTSTTRTPSPARARFRRFALQRSASPADQTVSGR